MYKHKTLDCFGLNRIYENGRGFNHYGQQKTRVFSDIWIVNNKMLTNLLYYFSKYAFHVLNTKQLDVLGLNRIYENGRGFINYGQQNTRVFSDLWIVNEKLLTYLFHYFSGYALHVLNTRQIYFLALNRINKNDTGFINYGQRKNWVFSDVWEKIGQQFIVHNS